MTELAVETNQKNWDTFFNKLGYVYYAMAEASGQINADNMERFKKSVQRIWPRYIQVFSGFQGYHANKLEALFDWLGLNETDWSFCLNEWVSYLHEKPELLNPSIKQGILDTAAELSAEMGDTDNRALRKLKSLLFETL